MERRLQNSSHHFHCDSYVRRVEAAFMQTLSTMHARARDWSGRPDVQQLVAGLGPLGDSYSLPHFRVKR